MKTIQIITFSFIISISCYCQPLFSIRIIDADTKEPIKGAKVYLRQLASSDKYSGGNGELTYSNLPKDRKLDFYISHKDYKSKTYEKIEGDNNPIVELEKNYAGNQVIVYGKIQDLNTNGLPNCKVTVILQGEPFSSNTNEFGYYKIGIEKGLFRESKSYIIQAKIDNCTTYETNEDNNNADKINKNITLNCKTPSKTQQSGALQKKPPPDNPQTDALLPNSSTLNGKWVGNINVNDNFGEYALLLEVKCFSNKIKGFITATSTKNNFVFIKFSVNGTYTNDQITVAEVNMIDKYGIYSWCLKQYIGQLFKGENDEEILFSGDWNNDNYKLYDSNTIKTVPTKCNGSGFILKKITD